MTARWLLEKLDCLNSTCINWWQYFEVVELITIVGKQCDGWRGMCFFYIEIQIYI